MEKKIQGFQWPTLLSMIVPTPSCAHHQSRQENIDRIRCQGLWLKYLLQTLESVMLTEPQLQHCWVDIYGTGYRLQ
ncbi:hypothetical protein CMV_019583 [Castanea mollissima]|uniref:Uncharacterized protein n=1 Tax=Castanea mollissima TaxID=60419 RepID=A0A8J4VGJ3_9ROSI|nr:hypothetical protein CMV_019583 [Castanea mollissima]